MSHAVLHAFNYRVLGWPRTEGGAEIGTRSCEFLDTACLKPTHRLHSSSFLGLPYSILHANHEKELLWRLWVDPKLLDPSVLFCLIAWSPRFGSSTSSPNDPCTPWQDPVRVPFLRVTIWVL